VRGVIDWVDAGGPGLAAPPPSVSARIVPAPGPKKT